MIIWKFYPVPPRRASRARQGPVFSLEESRQSRPAKGHIIEELRKDPEHRKVNSDFISKN